MPPRMGHLVGRRLQPVQTDATRMARADPDAPSAGAGSQRYYPGVPQATPMTSRHLVLSLYAIRLATAEQTSYHRRSSSAPSPPPPEAPTINHHPKTQIPHHVSVRKFQNEVYSEVLHREFYGKIHESFRFETSPVPPTLKLPDQLTQQVGARAFF